MKQLSSFTRITAIFAVLVSTLFGAPSISSAQVIEDQIGSNYEHLFPHLGTRAFWESPDSYSMPATRRISPLSGTLGTFSIVGIGVDLDATRNMTTEEWGRMDFKILFYSSTAIFLNDPENYTWFQNFDVPTNSDWLTPIGTYNGFNRYRFDFDLSFMNESLSVGQDFAIGFVGLTNDSVVLRTAFSTGGGLGTDIDLFGYDTGTGRDQDYLNNLGAPSNWHATSVTVVPEPGTIVGVGAGIAWLIRRKRRSRG